MIRRHHKSIWKTFWFALFFCLFFGSPNKSLAHQISSVESESTVTFTGIYEPIGTPDPKPPENIVKPPETVRPEGSLPQTNDSGSPWLSWLGSLMLVFVFFAKRRKNQKN